MPKEPRKTTSFSISLKGDELLLALANFHGITRTAVIEMIVRAEARKLGLFDAVMADAIEPLTGLE